MHIDITPILQALIGLLSALITLKLIPWLTVRTSAQNLEAQKALIKTLVFAAEQLFSAQCGAEKIEYVKNELQMRGFTVDLSAIEAAVCELKLLKSE